MKEKRVRFLKHHAVEGRGSYYAGWYYHLPADIADGLLASGIAEEDAPAVQTPAIKQKPAAASQKPAAEKEDVDPA